MHIFKEVSNITSKYCATYKVIIRYAGMIFGISGSSILTYQLDSFVEIAIFVWYLAECVVAHVLKCMP